MNIMVIGYLAEKVFHVVSFMKCFMILNESGSRYNDHYNQNRR